MIQVRTLLRTVLKYWSSAMPSARAYAIEVQGNSAGIVVANANHFIFYAADWAFGTLDRKPFRTPAHAERAARDVLLRRAGEPSRPAFQS
jgi:hypothetical protein